MTTPEHEPTPPRGAGDANGAGRSRYHTAQCRAHWSPEFRYCTATAHDASGERIAALTFGTPEPCADVVARVRMEAVALAALRSVLEALERT